jgi:hypothetical protein
MASDREIALGNIHSQELFLTFANVNILRSD